jgi:RNA polymerase sigma-70 factor (ECF subfamily)
MRVTTHTVEKQLTNGIRALADFMLGGPGRIRRPASRPRSKAERQ